MHILSAVMLTLRQLHGLLVAAVVTSILLLLVPQTRLSLEVLQQASRPLAAGGDSLSLAASPQRVLRLQQEDEQGRATSLHACLAMGRSSPRVTSSWRCCYSGRGRHDLGTAAEAGGAAAR